MRTLIFILSFCSLLSFNNYSQQFESLKNSGANKSCEVMENPQEYYFNQNEHENSVACFVPEEGLISPEILLMLDSVLTTETIGTSYYDLQTNSAIANRMHRYADSSIGVVWMRGISYSSFPDRGTGFNYFDGNSWDDPPAERIEDELTGWPTYSPWGLNGEIVAGHSNTGILFSKRETRGEGSWSHFTFYGPAGATALKCPQMITDGENNNSIHLLANSNSTYLGQSAALLYSRSQDGGNSWNIQNIVLPGTGSGYYTQISLDNYVWAKPNGGAIAFVVGSKWHDLFLMKSTDDGTTWQKTVIWEHPYPMFNSNTLILDTLWTVDGSFSVSLDNQGNAHVVYALTKVRKPNIGSSYSLFYHSDGIGYWNESMGTIPTHPDNPHLTLSPSYLDENGMLVGWSQDINGNDTLDFEDYAIVIYRTHGISTMPVIHVDDQNNFFVFYSSTTETYNNGERFYKKIWARASDDGGETWGDFLFVADDNYHLNDECIYSQIANTSDDNLYYIFHADTIPGLAIDGQHGYIENRIEYGEVPKYLLGIYTCMPPDTIHVCNTTINSTYIFWNSAGYESNWELLIGPAGFDPETDGILISGIYDTNYTITNLEPETTYDFYIRAVCGVDCIFR
jgi:hypothetical protein